MLGSTLACSKQYDGPMMSRIFTRHNTWNGAYAQSAGLLRLLDGLGKKQSTILEVS